MLEWTIDLGLVAHRWIDFDFVIEMSLADDAGRRIRALAELDQPLLDNVEAELFPELAPSGGSGALTRLDEPGRQLPQAGAGGPLTLEQWRAKSAPQVHVATASLEVVSDNHDGIERRPFDGVVNESGAHAAVRMTGTPTASDDPQKARAGGREIFKRLEHDLGKRKVEFRHALGRWVAGFGDAGYIGRATRGESIPMLRRFLILAALSGAALASTTATDASAQGAKSKPKKGGKLDLGKIKADLESGDSARMTAALEAIQASGDAAAAPLVDKLLKKGASTSVLVSALGAAAALKQTASSAAVAPYVKHRTADVRRAATKALIKTKGPDAVKALRDGLRSSDAQVRGVSATGLGSLGAKDALDDLFTALAHNVGEAAAAVGQLCEPKQCEKFAALTGKHPFDIMSSGFDQILFRPEKEMPDDQKIRIVGRCRELGTKESGKYLADVQSRWPKEWSRRVKQAIDGAVKATGGSAGGDD